MDEEKAIKMIQKLWRCYTNKKIFKYYKDIVLFKCKGNPARLLKAINPNEGQLLDAAAKAHVRFRLGGENFPPVIYYKIYSHGGVIDMNAFAPRDYALLNRQDQKVDKIPMSEYKQNQQKYDNQGWYLRLDNNGWRPISNKQLVKNDYIELYSQNKIRYYHHKKEKRDEKINKKTKMNKVKWMQSIQKPTNKETTNEQFVTQTQQLMELDDDQFDQEVQNLIEWTDGLNFDKYMAEWFQLSTSNASENYVKQPINVIYNLSQCTYIDSVIPN